MRVDGCEMGRVDVPGIRCVWLDHLYYDKCMKEMRRDHVWREWSVFFLEYDRYDVIACREEKYSLQKSKLKISGIDRRIAGTTLIQNQRKGF